MVAHLDDKCPCVRFWEDIPFFKRILKPTFMVTLMVRMIVTMLVIDKMVVLMMGKVW